MGKTTVMRISRQPSPIKIMVDKKQLKNVEYLNYLGSMITNDKKNLHFAMAKAVSNEEEALCTSKKDLNVRNL